MNFTIFGNPVEHSKSPQMQNAGFEQLNFDGKYTKTHLEDGGIIKDVFLKNNLNGANITVPHKEDAFKNADEVRGMAQKIGAVNTYILEDTQVVAYNTDAPGFMKAIESFGNINSVLLLGAGGTAKAIAVALKEKNIEVTVLNRSQSRLEYFKELGCIAYTWDTFKVSQYDLIVNSTSAGLKDEDLPAPKNIIEQSIQNSKYAFDCIYGKKTPFLQLASQNNIQYKDGEDMLLYQGVIAFEYFTKQSASKDTIEAMRKGLKKG
ncbi:MAG: shikimate dehydrogenase [Campylobacteraceae bacterium]|nr:shikimate dehydrogenase [Campylobacteraceae bacterium]